MAGQDEILIVYAFLDTLASNAKTSAEALAEGSQMTELSFSGNPQVTDAFRDFLGKWDEHRGGLHEGVAAAADAFQATSTAFHDAEAQLIAALNGEC